MIVVYAKEKAPLCINKSIFLAGPTPRSPDIPSWRPEALEILRDAGYDGVVFVPEERNGAWKEGYEDQIEWEEKHLNMADCILFWVPRNKETLPGFTTNIEWGMWQNSGKVVFGAPPEADKIKYILHYTNKLGIPASETLEDTIQNALDMVSTGAVRCGGERGVPLHVWHTPHFQEWYQAQMSAGNTLDGARVEWVFRVGSSKKFVLFWALHVDIYVATENRNKSNEIVLARPDISTICMYRRRENIEDTDVVLVKEFRSMVSTSNGFVWELPGGASLRPLDPLSTAVEECREETGLNIEASRLKMHTPRQLAATSSTHKAHLFSIEITEEELQYMRSQKDVAYGVPGSSERTYIEVVKLRDLFNDNRIDWSMIGMIISSILD